MGNHLNEHQLAAYKLQVRDALEKRHGVTGSYCALIPDDVLYYMQVREFTPLDVSNRIMQVLETVQQGHHFTLTLEDPVHNHLLHAWRIRHGSPMGMLLNLISLSGNFHWDRGAYRKVVSEAWLMGNRQFHRDTTVTPGWLTWSALWLHQGHG